MKVLIYGPRKSGTTLFQRLLDGGNELFVHPSETKIKYFISLQKKYPEPFSAINKKSVEMYFRVRKKRWKIVENDTYIKYIRDHYKSVKSLADYINLDVKAAKVALGKEEILPGDWAIKEISGNTSEILNSFSETFKDGKILIIFRDPRRVASAVYREKKRSGTNISLKRGWSIAKESYSTISELSKFVNNERVMFVYFEELIQNTEIQMRRVADFLNISFTDIFLKPTINGIDCIVPTSSRPIKQVFKETRPLYKNIKLWQYLFILMQSFLNADFIRNYRKRLITNPLFASPHSDHQTDEKTC